MTQMSPEDRAANVAALVNTGLSETNAARTVAASDRSEVEELFDELVLTARVKGAHLEASLAAVAPVLRHVLEETSHPAPMVGHLHQVIERAGRDRLELVLEVIEEIGRHHAEATDDQVIDSAEATATDDVNEGIYDGTYDDVAAMQTNPDDHRARVIKALGEAFWPRWSEVYDAKVRELMTATTAGVDEAELEGVIERAHAGRVRVAERRAHDDGLGPPLVLAIQDENDPEPMSRDQVLRRLDDMIPDRDPDRDW